jgi:hypothetical protein
MSHGLYHMTTSAPLKELQYFVHRNIITVVVVIIKEFDGNVTSSYITISATFTFSIRTLVHGLR